MSFKCMLCAGTEHEVVKDVLRGGETDTKAVRCKVCGQYDLITMFHLLEHLTAPVLFLSRLKALLKKGGTLVVELPNVDNIMMAASPQFNDFFYFRDHVAYYTPQQFVTVLEKSGFEVISDLSAPGFVKKFGGGGIKRHNYRDGQYYKTQPFSTDKGVA